MGLCEKVKACAGKVKPCHRLCVSLTVNKKELKAHHGIEGFFQHCKAGKLLTWGNFRVENVKLGEKCMTAVNIIKFVIFINTDCRAVFQTTVFIPHIVNFGALIFLHHSGLLS